MGGIEEWDAEEIVSVIASSSLHHLDGEREASVCRFVFGGVILQKHYVSLIQW